MVHRHGSNLKSQFVSVIEPYTGENLIKSIEPVEVRVAGKLISDNRVSAKVTLKSGRTDYIVNSLDNGIIFEVDNLIRFSGFLGVCSLIDGKPVYAYLNDFCDEEGAICRDLVIMLEGFMRNKIDNN